MLFVWTNIYEDGSCFIWHFSNPHVLTFQTWRWSCMTLRCWQQQSFVLRNKCVGYSEELPCCIHVDVIDGSSSPPPPLSPFPFPFIPHPPPPSPFSSSSLSSLPFSSYSCPPLLLLFYPTPITLSAYWEGQTFRSTRKWCCVIGWVVSNILQGCSAFVFKVKQSQKQDSLTLKMKAVWSS